MEKQKQSKFDPLRKLVREEVINALRKELPALLAEQFERQRILNESTDTPKVAKKNIKESLGKQFGASYAAPATLNKSVPKPAVPNLGAGNPLQSLLEETAMTMTQDEEYGFATDDVAGDPTNFFQPREAQVGDIKDVLATARPSSNIEAVQINTVPDFNALMNKMMAQGAI